MKKYESIPWRIFNKISPVLIVVLALILAPSVSETFGVKIDGVAFVMAWVLFIFVLIFFTLKRHMRWIGLDPKLRKAIRWVEWSLDKALAKSPLSEKKDNGLWIPKASKWSWTPTGLAFSLENPRGSKDFEEFADIVKRHLPEDYRCDYRKTSDSKSVYWIVCEDLLDKEIPGLLAAENLSVPLGWSETGEGVVIDFLSPWHLAIQGQSRSGKSVSAYKLLGSLSECENVVVAGCDPTGVLLSPFNNYPFSDWRACGGGSDFVGVIDRLVQEMDRRISRLVSDMERGVYVDKLSEFSPELPLLVVVLEEYPGLLSLLDSEDKVAGRKASDAHGVRVRAGVRRLIQEGAKVGVRVVMIAQRFDASIVGGAERSNLGTRISHKVDNLDAVKMLHPNADSTLMERFSAFKPGYGYIEQAGQEPQFFRSYGVNYEKYARTVVERGKSRGGGGDVGDDS